MAKNIEIRDTRNGEWYWSYSALLADPHITQSAKLIYASLSTFFGYAEICPSIIEIGRRANISERAALYAIGKLEKAGYIKVEGRKRGQGRGHTNVYYLLKMPKGCKKCGFSQEQQNPQTTTENPQNATIKSATVAPNIDNDIDTKIDTTITAPTSGAGNEVNKLIDLFKDVNPSWERLFARKGERQAIERLIAKHGKEKVGQMISALPRIIGRKYAPRITTPYQLESKLGDLVAYLEQQKDIHSPIITIS